MLELIIKLNENARALILIAWSSDFFYTYDESMWRQALFIALE